MINPFYEKVAKLVVNYSLNIKKGERVYIEGPTLAEELFRALYIEILKIGAHPFLRPEIEGSRELFFKYASEEQLIYLDNAIKLIYKEFDCFIPIIADYNPKKLSLIDPKLLKKRRESQERKENMKIFDERVAKGELRWVGIPFPCQAFAQEANMDLFSYIKFVEKALFLDKEDPVKEWLNIEKRQEKLVEYLNNVDNIQVLGEDTDLKLSVKGRKWINNCGHDNLPDGEVWTGPIEDSVNGYIRFTYPGRYLGKEIENIYLEFKNGKVSNATADKGEDSLHEILKIENADILGEFAVSTNYGITKFTKNIVFDEKMGGTMHCALGLGIEVSGSKNWSPIHWDILKDMKTPGSKIIADGKIIYEEGKWKI